MTDAERNAALAALFGGEGYEAAKTCPQGHENWVAVEHSDYDDHDEYVDDIGYQAGALCLTCMTLDQELMRGVPTDNAYYRYDKARNLRHKFHDDWPWHPEFRIQSAPKDFSVPGVLEPLARKLLARWSPDPEVRLYQWMHYFVPAGPLQGHDVSILVAELHEDMANVADGTGPTYEIALGEALLGAAKIREAHPDA